MLAAENLHNEVPIFATFFSEDWEEYTTKMYASGEFSSAGLEVPFEPAMTVLNHYQELNLGRTNRLYKITNTGTHNIGGTGLFALTIQELPDSALLNVVHHWTAADPYSVPEDIEVSNSHYWTIRGILPEGFSMDGVIRIAGGANQLDYDLVQNGLETANILYRPDSESEWEIYPDAIITPLGGGALVRLEPFIPGDYTLANVYVEVGTKEVASFADIRLSPNPGDQFVKMEVNTTSIQNDFLIRIFDNQGQLIKQINQAASDHFSVNIMTAELPNGIYIIDLFDGKNHQAVEMLVQH